MSDLSFALAVLLVWLVFVAAIFALVTLGNRLERGWHHWHERFACQNCGRVTQYETIPHRCPSCGTAAARQPVVVRWVMPFVWEQLDEDEARTGIKAKPSSFWSRMFGATP